VAELNEYWTGHKQANIGNLSLVAAKWGSGAYSENRLRMINGAFEIYFLLKTSIGKCPDFDHRELMTDELDDAGTSGFGVGVKDLDDAFRHWKNGGTRWTDNNTTTYMKVGGIFGAGTPTIKGARFYWGQPTNAMDGPEAAVNFFNALDSKMTKLSNAITGHNGELAGLATAVGSKHSAKTKDALGNIAKFASIAKKFLFLAPNANSRDGFFNSFTDLNTPSLFTQKASPAVREGNLDVTGGKAAGTFLSAISDLDKFLEVHDQALRTGIFDNKTSTAFAALTVALGKVPILGSFYAEIAKNIPGLIAGISELIQNHYRTIDRMTRVN
jgi:hypothetical protein